MEQIIPPGNNPYEGKLRDLHMLVLLGGVERTEDEFRVMLQRGWVQTYRDYAHHVANEKCVSKECVYSLKRRKLLNKKRRRAAS